MLLLGDSCSKQTTTQSCSLWGRGRGNQSLCEEGWDGERASAKWMM